MEALVAFLVVFVLLNPEKVGRWIFKVHAGYRAARRKIGS